jgi:hypothetical protein
LSSRQFAGLLVYAGWVVLVGGWALAIAAFFIIGRESCATVQLPLAGPLDICQDTTPQAIIVLAVVGLGATLGSIFLWSIRYLLLAAEAIEASNRGRK